jgi:hypothetical protein
MGPILSDSSIRVLNDLSSESTPTVVLMAVAILTVTLYVACIDDKHFRVRVGVKCSAGPQQEVTRPGVKSCVECSLMIASLLV